MLAVAAAASVASVGAGGCCRHQALPAVASAEVVAVVAASRHYPARLVPACQVQVRSHSQEASAGAEERLQVQRDQPLDNQAEEVGGEEATFHRAEETWASVEEAGAEAVPAEEASAAAPAAAGSSSDHGDSRPRRPAASSSSSCPIAAHHLLRT